MIGRGVIGADFSIDRRVWRGSEAIAILPRFLERAAAGSGSVGRLRATFAARLARNEGAPEY